MSCLTIAALFWLAQVTAPPVEATKPDTKPIQQSVADLLQTLEEGDEAASAEAEDRLIELGSDALPHLPKVTDETAERTRIQLRRIRNALSTRPTVEASEQKKYSLVGNMTAEAAFESLRRQAGLPLDILEDYEAEMSATEFQFDVKEKPFWEAVAVLLEKSQLTLSPYSGDARIFALDPDERKAGAEKGHVDITGPFRLEVTRFEAVRDFLTPSDQVMRLVLMVYWEPTLVPVTFSHSVAKIKVESDDGPVELIREQMPQELAIRENLAAIELEFPFELPSRKMKQINELSGNISAMVPGKTQKFTFNDLGKGPQEQELGEVNVAIERAKTVQNLQDIRVIVKLGDVNEEMKTHVSWVYNNIAYLSNADGKRFDDVLTEIYQETEGEVGILYKYDAPGDVSDYTFHYESPTGFTSVSATYSLQNIELP